MAPDTHIKPHFGPTNKKLRCHLPLLIPSTSTPGSAPRGNPTDAKPSSSEQVITSSWLRVADEVRYLEEGKCVVFDDSFEHEAMNTSSEPRVVLIVDFWHPDLTDEEVLILVHHCTLYWYRIVNSIALRMPTISIASMIDYSCELLLISLTKPAILSMYSITTNMLILL